MRYAKASGSGSGGMIAYVGLSFVFVHLPMKSSRRKRTSGVVSVCVFPSVSCSVCYMGVYHEYKILWVKYGVEYVCEIGSKE